MNFSPEVRQISENGPLTVVLWEQEVPGSNPGAPTCNRRPDSHLRLPGLLLFTTENPDSASVSDKTVTTKERSRASPPARFNNLTDGLDYQSRLVGPPAPVA